MYMYVCVLEHTKVKTQQVRETRVSSRFHRLQVYTWDNLSTGLWLHVKSMAERMVYCNYIQNTYTEAADWPDLSEASESEPDDRTLFFLPLISSPLSPPLCQKNEHHNLSYTQSYTITVPIIVPQIGLSQLITFLTLRRRIRQVTIYSYELHYIWINPGDTVQSKLNVSVGCTCPVCLYQY